MTSQPRPVWLTREELQHSPSWLRFRYEAAPADAAEAIREALWEWWLDQDDDTGEVEDVANACDAVLRVLGYLKEQA